MTDALKMEPDAEARAVRAILGMSAICKEEKFVPLILEIERAFRDGAKAERERTRERDAAKDAVIEAARKWAVVPQSHLHDAEDRLYQAIAALDAIEADPT